MFPVCLLDTILLPAPLDLSPNVQCTSKHHSHLGWELGHGTVAILWQKPLRLCKNRNGVSKYNFYWRNCIIYQILNLKKPMQWLNSMDFNASQLLTISFLGHFSWYEKNYLKKWIHTTAYKNTMQIYPRCYPTWTKKRMRHYYNIIKSFNIWNEFLTRTYLMVPFYVVEALLGSLYIKKIQK